MRAVRSPLATFALALAVLAAPGAFAESEAVIEAPMATALNDFLPVWMPEDGDEIRFEVLRKGKHFGFHNVVFDVSGEGDFTATSEVELTAKFGPITAYKYRHDSVEVWQGGQFVGLSAETRKDGKDIVASAQIGEGGLAVTGTNFTGTYPADIIPANHWNVSQLYSNTILSTEGGQPLDVTVENLGRETVVIDGIPLEATKVKLASDLTIFLWYDDDGRWLKLNFTARGQLIEYVLQDLY